MATLPPDLDQLGEQLADAAGSTLADRRRRAERRRRVARAGVIGAVAFAVLTPGPLGSGMRDLSGAGLAGTDFGPPDCRLPDGATIQPPSCDSPMVLYRPYAVR